jgi:choline dehydrogenase-like flavoprotein
MLHDHSRGAVEVSTRGTPVIDYALDDEDQRELVEGMIAAGRVLFGAGAKEVYAATAAPMRFGSLRDLTQLWQLGRLENRVALNTPHPQGTCAMGPDRRTSVVDPWGQTHDVANVYVSDTSVFPTSIGAPPSMTAAALALRTARHILARR